MPNISAATSTKLCTSLTLFWHTRERPLKKPISIELWSISITTTVALDEAIARGQEALRLFGIDILSHPSHEKVAAEYEAIWRSLGHRPIEELIDLPLMTDPEIKAAMSILAVLFAPSIVTDRNLLLLCGCHMVNMSIRLWELRRLRHGLWLSRHELGPVFR